MANDEQKLYQEIGVLQGQMSALQNQQANANHQLTGLERRLTTEIEKLINNMNSRITLVEGERSKDRLHMAKIKWNVSALAFGATTIATFATQLFFHYLK